LNKPPAKRSDSAQLKAMARLHCVGRGLSRPAASYASTHSTFQNPLERFGVLLAIGRWQHVERGRAPRNGDT